ncbi:tripartite motif-containing protein 16 [Solea solea]|uniref:tripartite motif-containing protein 16 n=1 Tax=Solea solea TaxID=90069 RepID=UPI00272D384E|nr:tripartite motif-containing protein 16 [Solea solea]
MSDNLQNNMKQVILCDMCTGEDRKPAKKTCMKCEISMCVQHLQVHLTTPVLLQTHPLTEPMALSGTTKCPQHGKLLEYYCLDDKTCVCVSCAIEDQHRLHNMKTFSTAQKELMEKLKAEQEALLVKTDDENVSLEKWEKSEREKLSHCNVRLIEAVTNLRDITLTSVQSSVSARMVAIKTSKSSMQAAQNEKDTFRFLQMYSQVHQDMEKAKAVDVRKGLEPGSDQDKLVEEIRENGEKLMQQADNFSESLLKMVDPDQELFATYSDLIFEPQNLGEAMSMSEDGRKVFYNSWLGECFATLLIRSTQDIPNFRSWLVCLDTESDWTIGLCDKKSSKNLKDGPVFGLCCKNNQLCSLKTEYVHCKGSTTKLIGLEHQEGDVNTTNMEKQKRVSAPLLKQRAEGEDENVEPPETVEVIWNFVASSLSFFRRTGQYKREEILTIQVSLDWDLVPFFQLGNWENSQNSAHSLQNQWKCSCGKIYSKDSHRYNQGMCQFSHQTQCPCGQIIGARRITEVVCELQ